MKALILLLISFSVFAIDKDALTIRNNELSDIFLKQQEPVADHNRAMMYISPNLQSGHRYKPYLSINKISDTEIELLIPQGLNIQSCDIAPYVERARILDNDVQDKIFVNIKKDKRLELKCESNDLTKYFFVTFKDS